ncbi:MAG: hypothetical protein GX315_09415 [Spirochaetales bacterium]|nr:hypothetical protein [Spirochaetales bacterium]
MNFLWKKLIKDPTPVPKPANTVSPNARSKVEVLNSYMAVMLPLCLDAKAYHARTGKATNRKAICSVTG